MCFHVFVGSLLLTETGRLFPSLMQSSEVGCQHLCRQQNEEAEKKNLERWKGKAYHFTQPNKNKNLRLLTVCPIPSANGDICLGCAISPIGVCLDSFRLHLSDCQQWLYQKCGRNGIFLWEFFCEMREYKYLCDTERVI